jgi:glycosyltransferase involved in cell wall biosynthesis
VKNVLYLTFYYEPDLCAGSFRNTPLIKELADQTKETCHIDVLTTIPNRYQSYSTQFLDEEQAGNLHIRRFRMPSHKSGFIDQINSFSRYFFAVQKAVTDKKYDLVVASSSRLFTAYLGYTIAKKQCCPLYLDIRDIFVDTINDVIPNVFLKKMILPVLKYIERKTFSFATHINLISEGFRSYFGKYSGCDYSFFTNGIDDDFILSESDPDNFKKKEGGQRVITYAGNIGKGQGLHKIIPSAAAELGSDYLFRIIGDGGAMNELKEELAKHAIENVTIEKPVKRQEIINIYRKSDFIFIHLNDYAAFEKVLPSKVFEAGAFPRPILAGVNGFARKFIERNIDNVILFTPGKAIELVAKLREYEYRSGPRKRFIEAFKRSSINEKMVASMLQYLVE